MYVSEVIKDNYENWNVGDCIFLEAPTGAGKTTFILKELLPFVNSLNMELLYLSNRFLLKEQIKQEIAEKQDLPAELTWLENVEEFDGITIMSYQKLQLLCQQEGYIWEMNRRYQYVVCDEIHYLLEDSAFNPQIIWLVKFLKDISSCLVCISATLGELKERIVWEKYGVNVRYMKWVRENDFSEYLMFPKRFTTPMTLIYIHLTELLPVLLDMADHKQLPFNTAVELSYLKKEEQDILLQYMGNHEMVPSMKQAQEMKKCSKEHLLTYPEIDRICCQGKTEKLQVKLPEKKLRMFFPESYTKEQIEEVIFKLLEEWADNKERVHNDNRGCD
ncbi:DEAD/DEAH box helicase family protein [Mediterraneibacter agrestimuris]|uniref:DEAD/DEAH box helicase family protein n=1 Tax=Mediterraneibacter agrestimuris TaxID=2941333 RepID=UPI00203DF147|nr:DEAD/DEAH box helicase family protein [Mediterraneibacter agrestimuris]